MKFKNLNEAYDFLQICRVCGNKDEFTRIIVDADYDADFTITKRENQIEISSIGAHSYEESIDLIIDLNNKCTYSKLSDGKIKNFTLSKVNCRFCFKKSIINAYNEFNLETNSIKIFRNKLKTISIGEEIYNNITYNSQLKVYYDFRLDHKNNICNVERFVEDCEHNFDKFKFKISEITTLLNLVDKIEKLKTFS